MDYTPDSDEFSKTDDLLKSEELPIADTNGYREINVITDDEIEENTPSPKPSSTGSLTPKRPDTAVICLSPELLKANKNPAAIKGLKNIRRLERRINSKSKNRSRKSTLSLEQPSHSSVR